MTLDIIAEVRCALASEGLSLVQLDERIEHAVIRALEHRAADHYMSRSQLARRLGITPKALGARLSRGSALVALAQRIDGHEVFSSAEVDGLIARGGR